LRQQAGAGRAAASAATATPSPSAPLLVWPGPEASPGPKPSQAKPSRAGQFWPDVNSGLPHFPVKFIQIQFQVLIFQNSYEIHLNLEFNQISSVS
jgi:hypothetical protein